MELPDTIDRVRPSIIQIRVSESAPGPGQDPMEWMQNRVDVPIGTGFLVGRDGFAITARHVTRRAHELIASRGDRPSLYAGLALPNVSGPIQMRANFEVVECDVVEEDPRHDLALLRLRTNPFTTGRRSGISRTEDGGIAVNAMYAEADLSLRNPRDGDCIAVSGYPLDNPVLITTAGIIASAWAMDVTARANPTNPAIVIPDIANAYVADVVVNPGNSGGPAYFADWGDVIGVCVAFQIAGAKPENADPFFYNSGLTMIVPIQYVLDLVARNAETSE